MKRNDILWKSILEDIFDDFLKFFFPDADNLFDLERGFEYLDQELEQLFPPDKDQYEPRYVDKLVKVFSKTGEEECILVHIEVQGYRDYTFAERMFTYYYRIWDKHRKPVTAFAILTDDCKHYLPCQFEQSCLGTNLSFRFNSFKVLDQLDEALSASDNPFAQAILVTKTALVGKKLPIDELYRLKIQLAKRLLNRNIPKRKIGKLMNFLQFYVRLGSEKLDDEYDLEINRITGQKNIPMKIEEAVLHILKDEAVERSLRKRNIAIINSLLRETSFDDEQIARLVDLPVEFVREVKEKE